MPLTVVLLIVCAAVIYFACEFFVNGVEWCGYKLQISETSVARVLAAFGTALPETIVTVVAVAFGHRPSTKAIGIGAAFGGPLVLATLAYAAVGLTLLSRKSNTLHRDQASVHFDQFWFLILFSCAVVLGLVSFPFKAWTGLIFIGLYAIYVWSQMKKRAGDSTVELEPLKFRPHQTDPNAIWAISQTVIALLITFAASDIFVHQIEHLATGLALPPAITALLLAPLATELPEIMNSIIWIRQGKEHLALGNISGSMMAQATLPVAFGLLFTRWQISRGLLLSGMVTAGSVLLIYLFSRARVLNKVTLSLFALPYGLLLLLLFGVL